MTSVALEGLKNNINNYKGVMLCTRPNENIGISKERPFVSRVDPKAQLGINPVKKVPKNLTQKKVNPVLQRHRQWLNQFKEKMKEKRNNEEMREVYDKERYERIRDLAQRGLSNEIVEENQDSVEVRSPQADQPEQSSPQVASKRHEEEKPEKTVVRPKKKENIKEKPKWAYTEEKLEEKEEEDVDDLLNFTNNLDYEKYIDDMEVKHMVAALKKRIDEIKGKEEDEWKNKIVDAWNDKTIKPSKVDLNMDARSDTRSVASEGRSVTSEKTQKSITELKAKLESKEKKDWDNISATTKKHAVTVEERIAKHVADEILRNNTEFRHFHSNNSVRKILEREAQKHLENTRGIKAPEIVSNKEYFTRKDIADPNNLPYLHRNPAI